MWTRNIDTGKWLRQVDTLSKENYESLKIDLEQVKLYSKCLSGSTYLLINDFTNIYPELSIEKDFFYNGFVIPPRGTSKSILGNEDEFYEKYLKESAFTIKNLFTPEKLLKDEGKNVQRVDLVIDSSTFSFQPTRSLVVDGNILIPGHRVLVKNLKNRITLPTGTDLGNYFSENVIVSSYEEVVDEVTSVTYEYYNDKNGIYKYDGFNFIRESDMMDYDSSYNLNVVVKMGDVYSDKQFHLKRLLNGYFPIDGDNIEFYDTKGWVLRNRVDYNNVYDLNFYDILSHGPQTIFDKVTSKTYSIPARTLAVGEFGAIINNQDKFSLTATYSVSNIISNKYKVNLRSIAEVSDFYWVCGDEGILLKVSKINFEITQIDLGEELNFTSISFINNLYGMVVGKFNTIYYTRDGGYNWVKIEYDEFEKYSYNVVFHKDAYTCLIGGEAGILFELSYSNNEWFFVNVNVRKQLSSVDEYILVEDINDIKKTTYVNFDSYTFSFSSGTISSLSDSINYESELIENNILSIKFKSQYFTNDNFYASDFLIAISYSFAGVNYSNQYYGMEYDPINNPTMDPLNYDFYKLQSTTLEPDNFVTKTFSLAQDINGNILQGTYSFNFQIISNLNIVDETLLSSWTSSYHDTNFNTKKGDIYFLAGNNETLICYDPNKLFTSISNNYVYLSYTQSLGDIKSIIRREGTTEIYVAANQIWKFDICSFDKISDRRTNSARGELLAHDNFFANRLYFYNTSLYAAGNNSILKFQDFTVDNNFNFLDPSFDSRIKSRFLVLDYDIGAKLNFFDDERNYRLPTSISMDGALFTMSNATFSITNLDNETNWIDYYSDAEKVFRYNSTFEDSQVVKFSTDFVFNPYDTTTQLVNVSNRLSDMTNGSEQLAPHFFSGTSSEFFGNGPLAQSFGYAYDLLLYKNVAIIKKSFYFVDKDIYDTDRTKEGDIIKLTSDVVDTNLMVNRVRWFFTTNASGIGVYTQSKPNVITIQGRIDMYLYTFSNFNESIINNLYKTTKPILIKNLNQYYDLDNLVENFNSHQIGIGYKLTNDSGLVTLSGLFNDKTAYYNLQSKIRVNNDLFEFKYRESFLNFGFTPTYNIYNFLNKINGDIFTPTKDFKILPTYYDIPGDNGNGLTNSVVFIDAGAINNYLLFGKDYYNEWRSFLINTFVDIRIRNGSNFFISEQYLVTEKYYDSSLDAYYLGFHKKINLPPGTTMGTVDIVSRNTLELISIDLQLLNNIHRSRLVKSVQQPKTFTNYESSIKTKFSTDSYLKALVSDYDIRKNVSAILYIDSDYEVAMNVLNVEKTLQYVTTQYRQNVDGKLSLIVVDTNYEVKIGDLVFLEFNGIVDNPMMGYHTVIDVNFNTLTLSCDYVDDILYSGTLTLVKKDPFFNYQPIDIFRQGADNKVTRSVEIMPYNYILTGTTYSLVDLDLKKYKMQLTDGLSIEDLDKFYHWVLEAEISNAIIGQDESGLVWYSGTWRCGRWFGGTWISGTWLSGDWYDGQWKALNTKNNIIDVKVDRSFSDENLSKWYNGRWYQGTWFDGIWYNGRRYAGDWQKGTWFNGIWNDGHWFGGNFLGGIWVEGTWESGIFNCNSKPAYWINGTFVSGDFENGIWYNGFFGNDKGILSRFGTKASNSRTATWHGGRWIDGEFHSALNKDSVTGQPIISDIHKYSIWRTGIWNRGNWYGGIAYNIDFLSGTWHGGILEEIQVIGIDAILPAETSTNKIYLNGIFRFNPGDEIWIIDDDRNSPFSPLGSNDVPRKYRINRAVEDEINDQTALFLNYRLSSLGVQGFYASSTFAVGGDFDNADLGLRVVSHFKDAYWKSGLWTNGIFDGNKFDQGIWYNGIFDGRWGN